MVVQLQTDISHPLYQMQMQNLKRNDSGGKVIGNKKHDALEDVA